MDAKSLHKRPNIPVQPACTSNLPDIAPVQPEIVIARKSLPPSNLDQYVPTYPPSHTHAVSMHSNAWNFSQNISYVPSEVVGLPMAVTSPGLQIALNYPSFPGTENRPQAPHVLSYPGLPFSVLNISEQPWVGYKP